MVYEIEGFLCAETDGLRTVIRGGREFISASATDDGSDLVEFGRLPEAVRRWLTRPKGAFFYNLPPAVREALDLWVKSGQRAGDFVMSVLENDFAGAVQRADPHSLRCLRDIVWYLSMECPSPCWGSPEKVGAWAARFPTEVERAP